MSMPMRFRSMPETRPGALLHNYVSELNISLVVGAMKLVTFFDELLGHVNTCHMKTREKAAELLKRHMRRIEHQTDCRVKKIVRSGGKSTSREPKNSRRTALLCASPKAKTPKK